MIIAARHCLTWCHHAQIGLFDFKMKTQTCCFSSFNMFLSPPAHPIIRNIEQQVNTKGTIIFTNMVLHLHLTNLQIIFRDLAR